MAIPTFIVLPHTLQPGADAKAGEVMGNFQVILDVVNGGIADIHISQDAKIDGAKIKDGSVTVAELAANAVIDTKCLTDSISVQKLMLDVVPNEGKGANYSRMISEQSTYTGSQAPNAYTDGGFTYWGAVPFIPTTQYQSFLLDNTHNWRSRLLKVTTLHANATSTTKSYLPGGASETAISQMMYNNIGLPMASGTGQLNVGMGYTADGRAYDNVGGVGGPHVHIMANPVDATGDEYNVFFYANSTTGFLWVQTDVQVHSSLYSDLIFHIEASPRWELV